MQSETVLREVEGLVKKCMTYIGDIENGPISKVIFNVTKCNLG